MYIPVYIPMYIHHDILMYIHMGKVLIYVNNMALDRIRRYASDKKIPLSKIFVRGALSIVRSEPVPKCNYCHNPSVGTYKIVVNNWDTGESTVIKSLCAIHLKQARSEGDPQEVVS